MLFRQLFDDDTWTYTYLLADESTHEAVMIDSVDTQLERDIKLMDELGLKLIFTFDTHVHADHVTASAMLRDRTGCKVGASLHGGVSCADLQLQEGDRFSFGSHTIAVIETPGHTDSCITFHCEERLFTGDALLIRGCGRTDFQQGSSDKLFSSITEKLYVLPDEMVVYPGHDYKGMTSSTIGEEKRYNPRLTQGREKFIELMDNLNLANPKRIDEAVPANLKCGNVD